jgi:hypothetical protein
MSNETSTFMTLDELLDSLGFEPIKIIIATFVLPVINVFGTLFCMISAYIFFQRKFVDPSFFYYCLLCIVYIINLLHNIPRGIFYTPRYFPNMNSYLSSIYHIYYSFASGLLFHFADVIQIAILLDRIKIFSPFVKRHFSAKPWVISFALFLTCLLIDLPIPFASKVGSFGNFFNKDLKQNMKFYYLASSDLSATSTGKFLFVFTAYFLSCFFRLLPV